MTTLCPNGRQFYDIQVILYISVILPHGQTFVNIWQKVPALKGEVLNFASHTHTPLAPPRSDVQLICQYLAKSANFETRSFLFRISHTHTHRSPRPALMRSLFVNIWQKVPALKGEVLNFASHTHTPLPPPRSDAQLISQYLAKSANFETRRFFISHLSLTHSLTHSLTLSLSLSHTHTHTHPAPPPPSDAQLICQYLAKSVKMEKF
jgi:hypothetical protein